MIGQRFGRLTVVCYSHGRDGAMWYCRCDCGGESIAKAVSLRYGTTKSCGCGSRAQAQANFRDRAVNTRGEFYPHNKQLKDLWRNMLRRCYDPRDKRWENYGGRGVRVCEEWRTDRIAFMRWVVANGWGDGTTLDRIDVNKGYQPENCRFVGATVQMNNTTRNRFIEFNGERRTVAEWARHLGVSTFALQHRFTRGWDDERALTQPYR